jgi:hypothetical protein
VVVEGEKYFCRLNTLQLNEASPKKLRIDNIAGRALFQGFNVHADVRRSKWT